jgi:acylglycerol lipase
MTPTANREGNGLPRPWTDVAFSSLDGTALQGRLWTQADSRGTLVIAHGLGEHGGSYRRTAEELGPALGIDIFAFDFRGSGRSAGKRGVVRSYDDLSLDLAAAIEWAARERPGLPRFLLGHSNGGLVSLRTVIDRDLGLTGLIVSNPSLRLTAHVPAWKRLFGEVLLRVAPSLTLPTGLSNEQLTQDPEVIAVIADDPLRHGRISPPLFFGMSAAGPEVIARAPEIHLPTLLILGGSDPIIDPEAGRLFFEKLGAEDKTLEVYPEMRHEPLNELGREQVLADVAGWIGHRL